MSNNPEETPEKLPVTSETPTFTPSPTACGVASGSPYIRRGTSTYEPVVSGAIDGECIPIIELVEGEPDETCDWYHVRSPEGERNGYICNAYLTVRTSIGSIPTGVASPGARPRQTATGVSIASGSTNTPQPTSSNGGGGTIIIPPSNTPITPPMNTPITPLTNTPLPPLTAVPTTSVPPTNTTIPTNPPPPPLAMYYGLYDDVTNQVIVTLTNGSTFSVGIGSGSYNIRVDPSVGGINSVQMTLDALSGGCAGRSRTERFAPYTLVGNNNGDYSGMQFGAGCSYRLTVTVHNGSNQVIQSETINFSVVP